MDKKIIPELPDNTKKLRALFKEKFITIWENEPEYIYVNHGKIAVKKLRLECPHCHNQFDAKRRSNGSLNSTLPNACPYCDFPKSVLCKLLKKEQ